MIFEILAGGIFEAVARSAIHLLSKLGAKLTLCGPQELLPDIATTLVDGVTITRSCEDGLRGADVIMVLRVQRERLAGLKVSLQDYVNRYQITLSRLRLAKNDALLMHPGPIIRGLERHGYRRHTVGSFVIYAPGPP